MAVCYRSFTNLRRPPMAEGGLALPMQPGSTCDPRWRAQLEALLALDERSLPSSDDEPMADSDTQLWPLTYSIHAIAARFADREDVYVSGDLFVHYVARREAGMPVHGQIAPDVLVVFGVEDRVRDSYVVWREGKPPDFVMEISSNRSWRRDRIEKRTIYEAMGVKEYFIYDPREKFRPPRLIGLRLQQSRYREIPFEPMPNGKRGLRSTTLGLYARVDGGGRLRWFDPTGGGYLRTYEQLDRERRDAEQRQRAAEAELARLREELRQGGRND
ncbi:MAG: Uma2 family endonuclease [Gammaproteobacteria bacterium]|nr:Uma2 family endonuclease [Gammaproteobacteria bacterium]MYK45772.1 Uma2 family endonuclease [Gammaproteobacteria bacterium]